MRYLIACTFCTIAERAQAYVGQSQSHPVDRLMQPRGQKTQKPQKEAKLRLKHQQNPTQNSMREIVIPFSLQKKTDLPCK